MDWKYNKNSVKHLETGLTIYIDTGTFKVPYEIRVAGDSDIDLKRSLRLVREGIAFGTMHESSGALFVDNTYELYEKPVPKVIIKKRRRIPGQARSNNQASSESK
ncbi:MAG: hypothetical protein KZQ92_09505 [Candidatus Thiodiazotropha sp. (ex Lucinoma borealis)]|nr:hypothetical protein [Candidatus Thiodiazotropha sp. (ex Lucinoma borealis)]